MDERNNGDLANLKEWTQAARTGAADWQGLMHVAKLLKRGRKNACGLF